MTYKNQLRFMGPVNLRPELEANPLRCTQFVPT